MNRSIVNYIQTAFKLISDENDLLLDSSPTNLHFFLHIYTIPYDLVGP
jgi:hypothetical protein